MAASQCIHSTPITRLDLQETRVPSSCLPSTIKCSCRSRRISLEPVQKPEPQRSQFFIRACSRILPVKKLSSNDLWNREIKLVWQCRASHRSRTEEQVLRMVNKGASYNRHATMQVLASRKESNQFWNSRSHGQVVASKPHRAKSKKSSFNPSPISLWN